MIPILLAGPTASGKSALALALAEALGGAVVNADALQVYAEWRILTARPSAADEARAPHLLYGHVPVSREYSTGAWIRDVGPALADCAARGLIPIVTGGTGLYYKALTEGLAAVPPIPANVRAAVEARLVDEGAPALAADLRARDPATAAETDLANPARVIRALQVLEATGEGLAAWRARQPPPALPLSRTRPIRLAPDRAGLYAAAETRFDAMMAAGALNEVARVLEAGPTRIAMNAHGARWLARHLSGEMSPDEARALSIRDTRRYAKRQLAWGRNQMAGWPTLAEPDPDAALAILRQAP